jgi:hypothetical protein
VTEEVDGGPVVIQKVVQVNYSPVISFYFSNFIFLSFFKFHYELKIDRSRGDSRIPEG